MKENLSYILVSYFLALIWKVLNVDIFTVFCRMNFMDILPQFCRKLF